MNNDQLRAEIVSGWRDMVLNGTMTQQQWDAIPATAREEVRDTSDLCPALVGHEGWKVWVTYAPGTDGVGSTFAHDVWHPRKFIVGKTSGWKPAHLALRNRAQRGSSYLLNADTPIISVSRIEQVR